MVDGLMGTLEHNLMSTPFRLDGRAPSRYVVMCSALVLFHAALHGPILRVNIRVVPPS